MTNKEQEEKEVEKIEQVSRCPTCNGELNRTFMPEEGVNYPIVHCQKCGWWR